MSHILELKMIDAFMEVEEKKDAAAAPEPESLPSVPWLAAVAERYEPRMKLGKGWFGDVYKAWDRESERFVAVKQLSGRATDDHFVMTPRQYFEQEVMSLEACRGHPSVVQLLATYTDSSRHDGDSFIVTEYAGCRNLREYIDERRQPGPGNKLFDEDEVRDIMEQLLAGARHAHKAGVLHRDIVPENVVVFVDAASSRAVCKICGFGMSKPAAQGDDGYGQVATSRHYRAPELELGSKDYGNRVDTYSLGAILGDLIAGNCDYNEEWVRLQRPVPPAQMAVELQKYTRQGSFPPEQMLVLSAAGFKVLKGLLATNPDRRLSAAAALRKPWFPLITRTKYLCSVA